MEQENQTHLHGGADRLMEIRERVGVVRDGLDKIYQKYASNAKATFEELSNQLTEIQSSASLSKANRIKEQTALKHKLDQQLTTILEQATQQHDKQILKIKQLEKELISQLQQCGQEILNNRQEMQAEEGALLTKIQEIGKDLHSKVKMLRDLRKSKKHSFLDLLESVIDKVQDIHVVKI